MRILILAQHFSPETTPTGRRAQDLAESIVRRGHQVTVITARPNHPATFDRFFCARAAASEQMPEGYRVLRVPVFRSGDARALKRLLTYFTFMLLAAWKGLIEPRPDAIVAISPLPAGLAALAVHAWYRTPLVFDLQDVWPDSARAVGVMKEGAAMRLLGSAERFLYRCCARLVVISEGFRRYLTGLGVPGERISVIQNGVEVERFSEARPDRRIKQVKPFRGRFLVGYIGNLGLAQQMDTMLEAAWHLRHEPVSFLLVGEGVDKQRVERRVREAGLTRVRFLRGVPRRRVPGLLAVCDALLVMLRDDPLFRITIPSKVYEYMAAGKPVLCSVAGECAEMIHEAGCGLTLPPSDGLALADGIRRLMQDPAAVRAMGESGARWVRSHFHRSRLMNDYVDLLQDVAEPAPGIAQPAQVRSKHSKRFATLRSRRLMHWR